MQSGLGRTGIREINGIDTEGSYADFCKTLRREVGEEVHIEYTAQDERNVLIDASEKYVSLRESHSARKESSLNIEKDPQKDVHTSRLPRMQGMN